ncbi:MAG: DUF3800 domain-containing protein [Thermodesulfobacteriota bacterium]|jgi:hypothetical protein
MHFYYIDESGDTGPNLDDPDQPVMVIGGVSVRDEGWNATHEALKHCLERFFGGNLPVDFELHADELLSPRGDGPFQGVSRDRRNQLCMDVLGLLPDRAHHVHYLAIDKRRMRDTPLGMVLTYNPKRPYLVGFDYLVTYINWFVKMRLGQSARGMIILDRKEQFHADIERIMRERRFGGAATHRVKWIVEFSYAIDSRRNPMIQFSDLVIYCIRRFVEMENGYHNNWPDETKEFYARCYTMIQDRVARPTLVERTGRDMHRLNQYVEAVRLEPRRQWRRHYNINR